MPEAQGSEDEVSWTSLQECTSTGQNQMKSTKRKVSLSNKFIPNYLIFHEELYLCSIQTGQIRQPHSKCVYYFFNVHLNCEAN